MRQIIFLSLFLVGCTDFPTILPQERCVTILDTEHSTVMNGEEYFKGVCQCQMYSWSREFIGKIGKPNTKPLLYCDKKAGFSPRSIGEIYIWQENIRLWLIRKEKGSNK